MPADEYASATGGSLKLKGVNSSAKVSKSHKKKKAKAEQQETSSKSEKAVDNAQDESSGAVEEAGTADEKILTLTKLEKDIEEGLEAEIAARNRGKTEAELRHEEHRRRKVGSSPIYHSLHPSRLDI